jgi:cytochrome c-type biogenesis protein CcmH
VTAFLIAAALLTLGGLVFVIWPLLRPARRARATAQATSVSLYRDQFAELERDLKLGTLDPAQYGSARAELERRLLDEMATQPAEARATRRDGWRLALSLAVLMPVCAGLLYWHLGQPSGIGAAKRRVVDPANMTRADFEAMTTKLAMRMAAKPDDPVGWLMLGRAYKALERYPEAVQALVEAVRRQPDEPEILAEYAEALGLQRGGNLDGQPMRLLERALKIDPNHPKALTLAGAAAFASRDYQHAVTYWERLLAQVPPDSELAQALKTGVAQARQAAGMKAPAAVAAKPAPEVRATPGAGATAAAEAGAETIHGEVRLATALAARAAPEDTVFVVARAVDGPRMPLAVVRKQVKDLPLRFALDDSQAMAPQMKLSGFPKVIVTARISKSGNATPQSGDLQGASAQVAPGARGVVVTVDSVVP